METRKTYNGAWMCEKVLSLMNHQGSADRSHSHIPPHTCQDGNQKINNTMDGVEESENLSTGDGNIKSANQCRKQYENFSKNSK